MKRRLKIIVSVIVVLVVIAGVVWYYGQQSGSGASPASSGGKGGLPIPKEIREALDDAPVNVVFRVVGFSNGSRIPVNESCFGGNRSPRVIVYRRPANTSSLVLIMYDPDAIGGVFYHWILYNIPGNTSVIPSGLPRKPYVSVGMQGYNDFRAKGGRMIGYGGPCPPQGPRHRYVFIMAALDTEITVAAPTSVYDVLFAMRGHVIGYGVYYGVFGRD